MCLILMKVLNVLQIRTITKVIPRRRAAFQAATPASVPAFFGAHRLGVYRQELSDAPELVRVRRKAANQAPLA
jgi:hypothetical protein